MSDIEKIEKGIVNVGKVIKVKSGYVREGLNGRLEVHVGNRGLLIENPEDYREDEFPKVPSGVFTISELQPQQPVNLAARVVNKYEVKEFNSNGRSGKVANLIINDGTASTRLVLWNEKTDLLSQIKEGDILKIENGYKKEGLKGIEITVNDRAKVTVNPAGITLPEIKKETAKRVPISAVKADDLVELKAAVVSTFGENFVYDMCPNCKKKAESGICQKCGKINPDKLLILNLAIDDGSGTLRAALFRDTAEKLLGMSAKDAAADKDRVKQKLNSLVGEEKVFEGRIKDNAQFGRLEMNVYNIRDINAAEEAKILVGE